MLSPSRRARMVRLDQTGGARAMVPICRRGVGSGRKIDNRTCRSLDEDQPMSNGATNDWPWCGPPGGRWRRV